MAKPMLAVDGIPGKWNIPDTIKKLAKTLLVDFAVLGFDIAANSYKNKASKLVKGTYKTIYLKLLSSLDPYEAVNRINEIGLTHGMKKVSVTAYIATEIPTAILKNKLKHIPVHVKRYLQIQEELSPKKTVFLTYREILTEMQHKFPKLFDLSSQNDHKLLAMIGEVVFSRLQEILNDLPNLNCFMLTKNYRKLHPHFGDFELVLNAYKQIVPGGDINETEFTTVNRTHPYSFDNVPFDKIQAVCNKYSERIVNKVNEHIRSLNTALDFETDTEEEIAKKKVRGELKKLCPHMNTIVKQVITENFIPRKAPFQRIRIYGEPFMPPKDVLQGILKRYHAVKITRSERIYNLLKFCIPPSQYGHIMSMDGTVISGATIIVRSSNMPVHIPSLRKTGEEMQFNYDEGDEFEIVDDLADEDVEMQEY